MVSASSIGDNSNMGSLAEINIQEIRKRIKLSSNNAYSRDYLDPD